MKYDLAASITSFGCPRCGKSGTKSMSTATIAAPVTRFSVMAFWKSMLMRRVSLRAKDCPTKGVRDMPIPCPKTSAMVVMAAEKATPAKASLPKCPTIRVSKNCTTL